MRKYAAITATETLPRITRFLGTTDSGPCEGGEPTAICPHCGSGGRYIHYFECEDGTTRGAMSGCVQLFPIHPIAADDMALRERERDLQQRFGKAAKLNSWDQKIREFIDAFYAGTMDERTARACITSQLMAKRAYRSTRRNRW